MPFEKILRNKIDLLIAEIKELVGSGNWRQGDMTILSGKEYKIRIPPY